MKKLLVLVSTLTVLLFATQARAGIAVAADLKLGVPLGGGLSDMLDIGYGIDGRLGYNLSLAVIEVQPELVVGYMGFGDEGDGSKLWRGMVGGRAALGLGLMPFVYAHIGYGSFSPGFGGDSNSAVTYDVGGGLDFSIPIINIGISGGYNVMQTETEVTWFDLGIHAQISF